MAAAACSSDDDAATGDTTTTAAPADGGTTTEGGDIVAESQARLDVNYAGVDRALPTASPAPAADKNVWIISCGQVAEGCGSGAKGAEDAGKLLGWDMTTYDGELNPTKWNEGIRQAIADGADGILLDVIDCVAVKSALDEAKAAGIKIVTWYSFDCDYSDPAEEARFDGQVTYGDEYPKFQDWLNAYGETMADWLIVQNEGDVQAIQFRQDELAVVKELAVGFENRLAECDTCELLHTEQITLADYAGPLQQKASTLLTQFPDANSVVGLHDSAIALGIGPAVVASGRSADLFVTGGECFAANIQFILNDQGQDFCVGNASQWQGWAAADALNRVFAGEEIVDAGIGWRNGDAEHNLADVEGGYDGTVDYRANYAKIWGVEG